MNELLKIGTKLIRIEHNRWHGMSIRTVEISKINKKTYTLDNKDLIYIDNLTERVARDVWSHTSVTYELFSHERWTELKLKKQEFEYNKFKRDFESKEYNLRMVKRYIEEYENEN